MLSEFTKVTTIDRLPDGELLGVNAEGIEICLARIGDEIFAIDNLCSHMHTWLDGGFIKPGYEVQCPLHFSLFNLKTGAVSGAPATEDLETYAVRIEGEDILVGPKEA
jgi:nitrite reductase/ring-hydroxylating ferredoxin subunit